MNRCFLSYITFIVWIFLSSSICMHKRWRVGHQDIIICTIILHIYWLKLCQYVEDILTDIVVVNGFLAKSFATLCNPKVIKKYGKYFLSIVVSLYFTSKYKKGRYDVNALLLNNFTKLKSHLICFICYKMLKS